MSGIKTGGPAFPAGVVRKSRPAHDPGADFHVTDFTEPRHAGMTLRDYFAAKAMQGAIASSSDKLDFGPDLGATWAYQVADAMLAAREKGGAA